MVEQVSEITLWIKSRVVHVGFIGPDHQVVGLHHRRICDDPDFFRIHADRRGVPRHRPGRDDRLLRRRLQGRALHSTLELCLIDLEVPTHGGENQSAVVVLVEHGLAGVGFRYPQKGRKVGNRLLTRRRHLGEGLGVAAFERQPTDRYFAVGLIGPVGRHKQGVFPNL